MPYSWNIYEDKRAEETYVKIVVHGGHGGDSWVSVPEWVIVKIAEEMGIES